MKKKIKVLPLFFILFLVSFFNCWSLQELTYKEILNNIPLTMEACIREDNQTLLQQKCPNAFKKASPEQVVKFFSLEQRSKLSEQDQKAADDYQLLQQAIAKKEEAGKAEILAQEKAAKATIAAEKLAKENAAGIKSLKLNELFIKLKVEQAWDIGTITDTKTITLELPQKNNRSYLYDMIFTGDCNLTNKTVRLLIEKVLLDTNKPAWNIRRQLPDEEIDYIDIGRIVPIQENAELKDILAVFESNGRFTLGKGYAELQSFVPKPEASNGSYTAESQKIETNKQPNSFEKATALLLGEQFPAYFYGITLFAGLGFRDQLADCNPSKFAKKISGKYDYATCYYLGFAEAAVNQKKSEFKKDLSPASVTCQLDEVSWKKNIGGKKKIQKAVCEADIPEKSEPAPKYSVPAANCSPDIQQRACFNDTFLVGPNPRVYEYDKEIRIHEKAWDDLPSSYCQDSYASQIYCTTNNLKISSASTKQNAAVDNNWVYPGVDARKSTQERVCKMNGKIPFFAICLNKKRLNVAKPTTCSLGTYAATCVPRIKGYESQPYTVNVDNCANAQAACGEIATVKECRELKQ
jgi:hypothetical protein